jgi:hypothetical protein
MSRTVYYHSLFKEYRWIDEETMEGGALKSRSRPGSKNATAKLTEEKVLEARRRYIRYDKVNGATALAKEFGVSTTVMWMVLNRERWTHI